MSTVDSSRSTAEEAEVHLARMLARFGETVPVVLDPVMVATSGDRLLEAEAVGALVGAAKEDYEPGWTDADVNCDGAVNILDKVQVRNQFGQTGCACPE